MKNTTRRGFLGAIAVAPIVTAAGAAARITAHNPDAKLLTAFRARQQALAAIELRGDYFDAEEHSLASSATFDQAEALIIETSAQTLAGVLAKLWVGLSAAGGQIVSSAQRHHHDIFRRCDVRALQSLRLRDLDYDEEIIARAIIDLTMIVEAQ